jgi:formate hydrogenlyase subunit 6
VELLDRIRVALRTGVVTSRYPLAPPLLEPSIRGLPVVDDAACEGDGVCVDVCPTRALTVSPSEWIVDAGRCVMCGACERACPAGAITLGDNVTLATRSRDGLLHRTQRTAGGR